MVEESIQLMPDVYLYSGKFEFRDTIVSTHTVFYDRYVNYLLEGPVFNDSSISDKRFSTCEFVKEI